MTIEMYQVDAFTNKVFGGNPAAVFVDHDLLRRQIFELLGAPALGLQSASLLVGDPFRTLYLLLLGPADLVDELLSNTQESVHDSLWEDETVRRAHLWVGAHCFSKNLIGTRYLAGPHQARCQIDSGALDQYAVPQLPFRRLRNERLELCDALCVATGIVEEHGSSQFRLITQLNLGCDRSTG